jgi:hypothetical protein
VQVASFQAFRRWRDPDSNRGHHDFQSWTETSLIALKSPAFQPVCVVGVRRRKVRNLHSFLRIQAPERTSVPKRLARASTPRTDPARRG